MNPTTEPTTPHRPIFKLAPVEDDLTATILRTRRDVIRDAALSLGARLLFVEILDLALNRNLNKGPGIVVISDTKLAEHLGRTDRVIRKWKWELRKRQALWTEDFFLPNMWPMTTYHITAISPMDTSAEKTTPEGLWGNGYRRPGRDAAAGGVRGTNLPRSVLEAENSKNANLLGNSVASGTNLPLSAEQTFRSPRNKPSAGSGTNLPLAAEQTFRSPRNKPSAGSGTNLPLAAEQTFRHIEDSGKRFEPSKGGEPAPAPRPEVSEAFKQWEARLDDMKNGHLRALERKIKGRLESVRSESARAGLKRQLKAVQDRLLPPVPDEPAKSEVKQTSAVLPKPKKLPLSELKKLWDQAREQNFPKKTELVKESEPKATSGSGRKRKLVAAEAGA